MSQQYETVYRVERDGVGPYASSDGYAQSSSAHYTEAKLHKHNSDIKHPATWQDGIRNRVKTEQCGFASLKQFRNWFNLKERRVLQNHGFELNVYQSDTVRAGGKQVVFERATANKVAVVPLVRFRKTRANNDTPRDGRKS